MRNALVAMRRFHIPPIRLRPYPTLGLKTCKFQSVVVCYHSVFGNTKEVVYTNVFCRVEASDREFLRLRGEMHFQTLIREDERYVRIFTRDKLHLPRQEGPFPYRKEYTREFSFPMALRHLRRELLIEEHPYCGASERPDGKLASKLVCKIGGEPLDFFTERKYLAPALATVSRYGPPGKVVTIKELRVSVVDAGHWQLTVSLWRGHRGLVGQNPALRGYLPVLELAEERLRALISEKGK